MIAGLLAKIGWGWAAAGACLAFAFGWMLCAIMSGGKRHDEILEEQHARKN